MRNSAARSASDVRLRGTLHGKPYASSEHALSEAAVRIDALRVSGHSSSSGRQGTDWFRRTDFFGFGIGGSGRMPCGSGSTELVLLRAFFCLVVGVKMICGGAAGILRGDDGGDNRKPCGARSNGSSRLY